MNRVTFMHRRPSRSDQADLALYAISDKLYLIGLSLFKVGHKRRSVSFHPVIVGLVLLLLITREIVSLLIDDRRVSMMLGDIAYKWQLKNMWNLTALFAELNALACMATNWLYYFRYDKPFWLSPPLAIHYKSLMTNKQVMILRALDFYNVAWAVLAFVVSMAILANNDNVLEGITCGLVGAVTNALMCLYATAIIFWQMMYFCFVSIRFKLQLNRENRKLDYLAGKMLVPSLKSIFIRINQIHKDIGRKNVFWSRIVFLNALTYSILTSIVISQFLGELETIMFLTMILVLFIIAVIILVQFTSAISVNMEANKLHNILVRLMNKIVGTSKIVKIKLKVSLQLC